MADACSARLDAVLGVCDDPMDAGCVDLLGYLELGACQAASDLGEK